MILYQRKDDDNENQKWIVEPFGEPFQPAAVEGPYGSNPYGTTPQPPPPVDNSYGTNPYGTTPQQPMNPYGTQPDPSNPYGSNPYGTTPQSGLAGYGAPDSSPYGAPIPYEQGKKRENRGIGEGKENIIVM